MNNLFLKTMVLVSIAILIISFTSVSAAKHESVEGGWIPPPGWIKTVNPTGQWDYACGVAVDSSGVYIVGGYNSPGEWMIEKRALADGTLIWSQTENPSLGGDGPSGGVVVDRTGIYIAGYDSILGESNAEWRIEKRSLTDGTLIWTQTSNPSGGLDYAQGIAIDRTGIYIVGTDSSPGNMEWRIEKRSLKDGTLLWSQTENPSTGDDYAYGVAVYKSAVYIVGFDYSSAGDAEWRIEKRSTSDGALIWSKTNNPSSDRDVAYDVAVCTYGVYIVGFDSLSQGNSEWRIEKRSLKDGSLLWSITETPSSSGVPYPLGEEARDVTVDWSGVYIAGRDSAPGNLEWKIEKRTLTDGSLLWSETENPSPYDDSIGSIAVDGPGIYLAGHDCIPGSGNAEWRIEKRNR